MVGENTKAPPLFVHNKTLLGTAIRYGNTRRHSQARGESHDSALQVVDASLEAVSQARANLAIRLFKWWAPLSRQLLKRGVNLTIRLFKWWAPLSRQLVGGRGGTEFCGAIPMKIGLSAHPHNLARAPPTKISTPAENTFKSGNKIPLDLTPSLSYLHPSPSQLFFFRRGEPLPGFPLVLALRRVRLSN